MKTLIPLTLVLIVAILTANSCRTDENRRIAELAERQLERQNEQNEQNRRMANMQLEVAEGSRRLVEPETQARQDMIGLHRDLQTEQATVGQQRDALEQDRREMAAQRHRDPIIAESIAQLGLLAACLLPLVVCWLLLRQPMEPAGDREVAELLIADLSADEPILVPRSPSPRRLESRQFPALCETPTDDEDPPSR